MKTKLDELQELINEIESDQQFIANSRAMKYLRLLKTSFNSVLSEEISSVDRLNLLKLYFAKKDEKHKSFHTEYHCKKWDIKGMLYDKIQQETPDK